MDIYATVGNWNIIHYLEVWRCYIKPVTCVNGFGIRHRTEAERASWRPLVERRTLKRLSKSSKSLEDYWRSLGGQCKHVTGGWRTWGTLSVLAKSLALVFPVLVKKMEMEANEFVDLAEKD